MDNIIEIVDDTDNSYDEVETMALLLRNPNHMICDTDESFIRSDAWIRPYWLGFGLFLILFAFWILDSLKEPIFALLLIDGDMEKHQPTAKLCSVVMNLILVCLLEIVSHSRIQTPKEQNEDWVLSGGGRWTRMAIDDSIKPSEKRSADSVTTTLFLNMGVSYSLIFLLIAYIVQHNSQWTINEDGDTRSISNATRSMWHIFAYFTFAMIESFGSLTVATFWSYVNSNLSLHEAERYYGLIIASAQVGAIGGSSMVTNQHWSKDTLLVVVCMVILLTIIVMTTYDRRFAAESITDTDVENEETQSPNPWSGINLILRNNYVLLILGVSCLYEISLTCLDYQMKLLGFSHFQGSGEISFSQFLGHFGQLTNLLSLFMSIVLFPFLIKKLRLRLTLLIFPTFLICAIFVTYTAIPGNLTVLFIVMSLLKAMTYSMHDPAKELLYMPTSNAIKFKAKVWIDVVGERVAKALGSTLNTAAGSVSKSLVWGRWPSIISSIGLWLVCYKVGLEFDARVRTGRIVGQSDADCDLGESQFGKYRPIVGDDDDDMYRRVVMTMSQGKRGLISESKASVDSKSLELSAMASS